MLSEYEVASRAYSLPDTTAMAEDIMGALLEEKKRREREKQSQEPALNPLHVQTDESQHTDSCQTDAGAKIASFMALSTSSPRYSFYYHTAIPTEKELLILPTQKECFLYAAKREKHFSSMVLR